MKIWILEVLNVDRVFFKEVILFSTDLFFRAQCGKKLEAKD